MLMLHFALPGESNETRTDFASRDDRRPARCYSDRSVIAERKGSQQAFVTRGREANDECRNRMTFAPFDRTETDDQKLFAASRRAIHGVSRSVSPHRVRSACCERATPSEIRHAAPPDRMRFAFRGQRRKGNRYLSLGQPADSRIVDRRGVCLWSRQCLNSTSGE